MALEVNSLVEEIVAFKSAGGSVKGLFQPAPDKAPENMSDLELLGAACSLLSHSRTLDMEYNGNIPARRAAAGLQGVIESAENFLPSTAKSILPGMLTGNLANFNNTVGRFFADSEAIGALKKLNERDRQVLSLFAVRTMNMELDLGVSKYVRDTLDAQKKQRETEAAQKAEAERQERERQEQLKRERQRKEEEARQREKEKREREERERLEKEKIAQQKREIENLKEALRQKHSGYVNNLKEITATARNSLSTIRQSIEKKKREIEEVKELLEKDAEALEKRKAETEYQEEKKEEEKKKEEKKEEEKKAVAPAPKKKVEPQTIEEAEYLAAVRKAFIAEHEEEKLQAERENEEALKAKEELEQEEARLDKEKRALQKKRDDLAKELQKVEAAWNKKQEPIIREKEMFDRFVEDSAFEEAERREREKWDRFAEDSAFAEAAERREREKAEREEAERREREEAERLAEENARIAEMVAEGERKTKEAEAAAEAMREKDLPAGEKRLDQQTIIENRPLRHYYYNALGAALSQFGLNAEEVEKSNDVRLFGKRSAELTNVTNLICIARKQMSPQGGNIPGVAGTMKGMKEYCIRYLNKYPKVRSTQSGRDSYDAMLSLLATCANPDDPEVKACIDGINQKRGVAGRHHAKDYIDLRSYGPDRLLGRKKSAADLLKETDKALVEKAKLADGGNKKAQAELKRLQIKKLYIKAAVPPNGAMYLEELDKSVTALTRNEGLVNALATAAQDPKKQDMIMIAEVNKQRGRNTHNRFYETPERRPLAADEVERRLGQKPVRDALDQINKDFTL